VSARAIHDFRKAGKKAFAYLDSIDGMGEYLVACVRDEVCVPESGWVMLTGLRMEVMFYKGPARQARRQGGHASDGRVQGAAEPMSRSTMSRSALAVRKAPR
jgi:hypothetical protein